MSAARKYTRAGTRRGTGAPFGAGGAVVGTDFAAGVPAGVGGAAAGADFWAGALVGADFGVGALVGAGGTAVGAGRVRCTYGARPVDAGGTADGRGATVVGGFGAPFRIFRCDKHLFLRASQAGSTPRLMHSPRA